MVIKTETLEKQFLRDISEIAINKNKPFDFVGSYKIKKIGEPITDIDLMTDVYYNEKLFQILSSNLFRMKKFILHRILCGLPNEFKTPWSFDDKGGCVFNLEKSIKWLKDLPIPDDIKKKVLTIINKESLRIRDIIDIENILNSYAEISWSLDDLKKGYKIILGTRYNIVDLVKKYIFVIELFYIHDNSLISVDITLRDKNFKSASISPNSYIYYTENWYKVMKSYRWIIEEQYRVEYMNVMKSIENLILQKSQQDLREAVSNNEKLKKYVKYIEIKENISEKINNRLEKYIEYFNKKVKPQFKKNLLLIFKRSLEAKVSTSKDDILEREEQNIQCPFYICDIDDYERVVSLAVRIEMDIDMVYNCFKNVSEKYDISIKNMLKHFGNNNLAMRIDKQYIILTENDVIKKHIGLEKKKILQKYILLKK